MSPTRKCAPAWPSQNIPGFRHLKFFHILAACSITNDTQYNIIELKQNLMRKAHSGSFHAFPLYLLESFVVAPPHPSEMECLHCICLPSTSILLNEKQKLRLLQNSSILSSALSFLQHCINIYLKNSIFLKNLFVKNTNIFLVYITAFGSGIFNFQTILR